MRSKMKFSQKNDNHMPKYVIGSKIVVKSLKISVHVYTKYRFIGYSKIDVIIFQCIQKLSFHKNDNNMPKYVILVNPEIVYATRSMEYLSKASFALMLSLKQLKC